MLSFGKCQLLSTLLILMMVAIAVETNMTDLETLTGNTTSGTNETANLTNPIPEIPDDYSHEIVIEEVSTPTLPASFLRFLRNTYFINFTASNRFLATDLTKFFCGTESLCDESLDYEDNHCSVECFPCHCDSQCHTYGDCCPDLLFRDPDTPSPPSPYVSCSKETWTTWGNYSNILMITSCPVDASPDVVEKCELADIGDQSQATPVSVVSSGITYRNRFCAQCHGVTGTQPWRHEVTCLVMTALHTARSKAELWRLVLATGDCKVVSHPPDGVLPRECQNGMTDKCSSSGTTKPVIEYLCEAYTNPVDYYGVSEWSTRYKNIFCAYCNGESLRKAESCTRIKSPHVPFPLTVLLDFNPEPLDTDTQHDGCETGEAYDPFSKSCRNIVCSRRRIFVNGNCGEKFDSARFLGFSLDAILRPVASSDGISLQGLVSQYRNMLHTHLVHFQPVLVAFVEADIYVLDQEGQNHGQLARVRSNVVSNTSRSITDMENTLTEIVSADMSYSFDGEIVTLSSSPIPCSQSYDVPSKYYHVGNEGLVTGAYVAFPECKNLTCNALLSFEPLPLQCPFLEYNVSQNNFTLDPLTGGLQFGNYSFKLRNNTFRICDGTLQICLESIRNITEVLSSNHTSPSDPETGQNVTLPIVSLVCISLSLAGLFLTFLIYSLLPKLRTLPGKNTMGLVFHLFWAQLLFLSTANRTTNAVVCQVFGILIHYFWMASFTWMLLSAYHMHTVFTTLQAFVSDAAGDAKRLLIYSAIGILFPVVVVVSCSTMHFVQSQGADTGYGGSICFLNNPTAIGAFFAGPLGLVLLLNTIFFVRTILAIRSVPDMTDSSSKSNKHHVFVYIKLSLLFGFTWVFGIVAAVFRSEVFWYVFTVLTGCQGLMLFVAYCANRRTWELVRNRLYRGNELFNKDKAKRSNDTSTPYTVSTQTKALK